jgi:phage terminase large subunit
MSIRPSSYDPKTPYEFKGQYRSPYTLDFSAPDYGAIFDMRAKKLEKIRKDNAWAVVKRFYADGNVCAFIEDWLMAYDPRLSARGLPTTMPLILMPRQIEYVEELTYCYENSKDLVVGKSRDMGVSVVSLAWATWAWLFRPGAKISVGSRKEALVDTLGNMDALLPKVRMYLKYLPIELLPDGYSENRHARFMRIINPINGASITGEAGDSIGRGGRSSIYFVDEAAFLERPDKIDASLSQNTNCRIDLSTPNGPDNPFARKWLDNSDIRGFAFHWTQDSRKNREWYDAECRRLNDPKIIAQELDLSFDCSGEESVVNSLWIESSMRLRRVLEETGRLPEYGSGVAGCDVGGVRDENVFVAVHGPVVSKSIGWLDDDTTRTAEKFSRLAAVQNVSTIKYDTIGIGRGVASTMRRLAINSQPVDVSKAPTREVMPNGRKARDLFRNSKAQIWWQLRDRLRKTHEHFIWLSSDGEEGAQYELDELLLLPLDDPELIRQISLPGYKTLETGRIQIESKDELKRRGVPSPDRADALVIALAPAAARFQVRRSRGLG